MFFLNLFFVLSMSFQNDNPSLSESTKLYVEFDKACSDIQNKGKKATAAELESLNAMVQPIHAAINKTFMEGVLRADEAGQLYISIGRRLADALSSAGQHDAALLALVCPKILAEGSAMEFQLMMAQARIYKEKQDNGKVIETLDRFINHPKIELLPRDLQRMYLILWSRLAKTYLKVGDEERAAEIYRDYFTKKLAWGGTVKPADQSHWSTYMKLTRKYGLERGKPELLKYGSRLGSMMRVKHPLPSDHADQSQALYDEEDDIVGRRYIEFQNGDLPLLD